MSANDTVEAVVLSVDKDNEKISLGIKQMEPDPWKTIEEKYPVGKIVSGIVRNLTAFGSFVELEEGIDGLVHISDMSWTKRIQHPSEVMKKGDKIEIKILKIDHENRRISLGFKQLADDPWPAIAEKYAIGSECLGRIVKVLDRGVIVDLDGEVEGFVPAAQLGHKELANPAAAFKPGDELQLQVIELEQSQRKIVLSVSAYFKKRDKSELDEFLVKHPMTALPASGNGESPAPKSKGQHKALKAEASPKEEAEVASSGEAKAADSEETEQL